ncbi:hypothetical protein [Ensifer sp. MJa1]
MAPTIACFVFGLHDEGRDRRVQDRELPQLGRVAMETEFFTAHFVR